MTREEQIRKLAVECTEEFAKIIGRAIDYGYALCALEVAEQDAKRNGAPKGDGEGDAPRKSV